MYRRLLASVLGRWPSALVDDLDDPQAKSMAAASLPGERLPSETGHLLFLRDAALVRHMDAVPYAPMPDGDGPIAVIARKRQNVELRCERLEELRATGKRAFPKLAPYSAWLCSPSVFEITVVTPDDPAQQAFLIWACEVVRRACRERT